MVYMEMPLEYKNMVVGKNSIPGEVERKFLGKESLDGEMVDKYRIVFTSDHGNQVVYSWIPEGSSIPVKTEAEDGSWSMVYKNIRVGRFEDSLFEIPSGYSKFSADISSLLSGNVASEAPAEQ